MKESIVSLTEKIRRTAAGLSPVTIMEVCGTHTHAIHRFGLRQLLPDNVRLISGPGCPVCVTDSSDIAKALYLAKQPDTILCCFGDMMRVPCGTESLLSLKQSGADVRFVLSPLDTVAIALQNPTKQVIWFAVGFETTAPLTAVLAQTILQKRIRNLSILCLHKTMPQAIRSLLTDTPQIDALLCPGHVATITGAAAFSFIPAEFSRPAVISGFEAQDILLSILIILQMIRKQQPGCFNAYPGAVSEEGNTTAQAYLARCFEPCTCRWRGLGEIKTSGLRFKKNCAYLDAENRFSITAPAVADPPGCLCAEILRGRKVPTDCPHFGITCTPETPLGACMVSSEGTCAAYYQYGGNVI